MRDLFMVLLLIYLLNWIDCRPVHYANEDDGEAEEADYEPDNENEAEDALHEDPDASLNGQDYKGYPEPVDTEKRRNEYFNRNPDDEANSGRSLRANMDKFAGFHTGTKIQDQNNDNFNLENQHLSQRRQPYKYLRNNGNQQQLKENSDNRGGSDYEYTRAYSSQDVHGQRLNNDDSSAEEGEALYGNGENRAEQTDRPNNRCDEIVNSRGRSPYDKRHDPRQIENKNIDDEIKNNDDTENDLNRDRREVTSNKEFSEISTGDAENNEFDNADSEDEQAAIKRHIKKLSGAELQELLDSLSDDKKALLQKIMDTDVNADINNINKREITKKAGAVEENSLLNGGQSETSKIHDDSSINLSTESSVSQNYETNATPKGNSIQTDDSTTTISSETGNSANKDVSKCNEETIQEKSESNVNSLAPAIDSATLKSENKREVKSNDYVINPSEDVLYQKELQDSPSDQSYVCSSDNDLSQLMEDEAQLHLDNSNTQKRETEQEEDSDFSDPMKSLQESFPNSYVYDDTAAYTGPDSAPLIRVKRRNTEHAVKKRDAAIFSDSKIVDVPYRAENDDEDNDEGNEFDDDGFFDRTANFAKPNISHGPKMKIPSKSFKSDIRSIGSDTDGVLSGAEGVDENLMISSGVRVKRSVGYDPNPEPIPIKDLTKQASDRVKGENKSAETYLNVHQLDNDAIDSFSKNCHGELGRYKRIRRLKQSANTKGVASASVTMD